ncbi:MAG: SAM-dependent methyltransferase [Eubacteriaceae bacterium]|nr:SAM-dependent methyltransferase [Eubacteriaceae bacterium]
MAASMTDECDLLADIGSDHAYLPVSLIQKGTVKRAIVTDLREGPLSNSRRTASRYALEDRIDFSLGSGFDALDGYDLPRVITVCGMGGELIKSFIEQRPDIASRCVLVLQPMNNEWMLEMFLRREGYRIEDQAIATDGVHYYRCMKAAYDGLREDEPSRPDCEFPPCLIERRDPVMLSYMEKKLDTARRILSRMESEGASDSEAVSGAREQIRILEERIGRYDS